jgi:hypothetical protein
MVDLTTSESESVRVTDPVNVTARGWRRVASLASHRHHARRRVTWLFTVS